MESNTLQISVKFDLTPYPRGIKDGSRVVVDPVEEPYDFDIALVCYKDNLVLKKLRRMRNGSIDLISADGSIITVPADDVCVPDLFAIWGKAMTYKGVRKS